MVQLNDTLLEVLDQRAIETGRSRSDLIREAIEQSYQEDIEAAIDRAIVEGYARIPADDELDALPRGEPAFCSIAKDDPGEPRRGVVGRPPGRWVAGHILVLTSAGGDPGAVSKITGVPATKRDTWHPVGGLALDADDGMPARLRLSTSTTLTLLR